MIDVPRREDLLAGDYKTQAVSENSHPFNIFISVLDLFGVRVLWFCGGAC